MKINSAMLLYFAILLGAWLASASQPCHGADTYSFNDIRGTLTATCVECHSTAEPQADLDLERFQTRESVMKHLETWDKIERRVSSGKMPPVYAETQLDEREKEAFAAWIKKTLQDAACGDGIDPGPSRLRRLNRNEYSATIRDLLGIFFNAGHALPADGAGGAGFDNAAETLFISPVHAERYLEAAKESLGYVAKDNLSRDKLIFMRPSETTTREEAALAVLSRFADRAFRRPATLRETARLMGLFRQAQGRGEPFEASAMYAMQAVLISPQFLFLIETPNSAKTMEPVGHYELASRLSYFLWGSMPDEELIAAAQDGAIQQEQTLIAQVNRMLEEQNSDDTRRRRSKNLEDLKFHEFANHFVSQWLGTRELGRDIRPDETLFPNYDQELEAAFQYEPVYVFHDLVFNNDSLLKLIDSDFTYASRDLARLYGIQDQVEVPNQQLNRVALPEGSHRGGIVTMAGVLAVSSYPSRTSPVLRGKWVLESILGTPPSPPPPNVPELEENQEGEAPRTLRERLMKHRANPVCATCHDRIDPLGFGLENFDPIGRWRVIDANKPIDSSGALPDGRAFRGPEELKAILMSKKDEFIRHLAGKMLSYALGRGLTLEDQCAIDPIMAALKKNNYRARTLIHEIVKSVPFRYKPGNEIPQPEPATAELWD